MALLEGRTNQTGSEVGQEAKRKVPDSPPGVGPSIRRKGAAGVRLGKAREQAADTGG